MVNRQASCWGQEHERIKATATELCPFLPRRRQAKPSQDRTGQDQRLTMRPPTPRRASSASRTLGGSLPYVEFGKHAPTCEADASPNELGKAGRPRLRSCWCVLRAGSSGTSGDGKGPKHRKHAGRWRPDQVPGTPERGRQTIQRSATRAVAMRWASTSGEAFVTNQPPPAPI